MVTGSIPDHTKSSEVATQVPVLITWDVDRYKRDLNQKKATLQTALNLCEEFGAPATFFFVAQEASIYTEEITQMKQMGHEIGCHGLTHRGEEAYNRMPLNMQRDYIERATSILEELAGMPVTGFRGPRVKISSITLKVLLEQGYLTDSSVCSQRLDLLSSNLINPAWLVAPRIPYHPHEDNAFKRGDLDILEVPVSALILPFVSTSLYMFGLRLMKLLFKLLYAESRRNGKPIVYLAHPLEFGPQSFRSFRPSDFSFKALRTYGLKGRKRFGITDPDVRLDLNKALFAYIKSFPGIQFMTMRQYASQFSSYSASVLPDKVQLSV
jgi:peptidoglycan/xylan/chitin deacetylase (PgdA/CDA1 family)